MTPPSRPPRRPSITIGGREIAAGTRETVEIPVADLYTNAALTMSVQVIHGRRPGPTLFVTAAIHGDELNGVEIIRRTLGQRALSHMAGTLIAVPIVNVHGVLRLSRYLPDRRDLNRSFPGSSEGSVAGRLAHVVVEEIVAKADYGIDLHTAAVHRANLPQIRADLSDDTTRAMAEAFGCPLLIDASLREGSLREYAHKKGVPLLLYEAGEALRFDEFSIRAGVRGITQVLRHLGMLNVRRRGSKPAQRPTVALDSNWERAPESGFLRSLVNLGEHVTKGQPLAWLSEPFGEAEAAVRSEHAGIVIGRTMLPLAHAGDAVYHVARVKGAQAVADRVEAFQSDHEPDEADLTGDTDDEPPIV
ncbi:succinylglutamate desuccinylase/aspartoacylase family protein [Salinisphaera orenii]|uniref:succinylglutamate desuccinylase/aspartoacylase family protein n=1 Tax=Salinisphaera orenii TaxID=856731 RepID=UPI000DBE5136